MLIGGIWRKIPSHSELQERLFDSNYTVFVANPRKPMSLLRIGNNYSSAVSLCEIVKGEVFELPPMNEERREPAVCYFGDGIIIAAGGFSADMDTFLSSAEKYDPASGIWHVLPSMLRAAGGAVVGAIDNKVYVIGGQNEDDGFFSDLDLLQIYDISMNSWSLGPPMPEILTRLSCVVFGGILYVVGRGRGAGMEKESYRTACVYFDPKSFTWTSTEPVNAVPVPEEARNRFQFQIQKKTYRVIVFNGQVLAFRARTGLGGDDGAIEGATALQLQADGSWVGVSTIPETPLDIGLVTEVFTSVLG